jgi:nucleoid DNA-binding protein
LLLTRFDLIIPPVAGAANSGSTRTSFYFCPANCANLSALEPNHTITWERIMATKSKSAKKPTTKSELLSTIAEKTDLKRKDVNAVFEELSNIIKRDLKSGPGVVNVYGLMKVKVVRKPATPARKGINPFTKEEVMFKAKPARNVVKILPLKTLKDMV